MFVPEVYKLALSISSRVDPRELNLSKKEISEFLAERRRVTQFYREALRPHMPEIRTFMDSKRRLEGDGGRVLQDKDILRQRSAMLERLAELDLHPEEITMVSDKFLSASSRIRKIQKEKQKIKKRLGVSSQKELRSLGRGLALRADRERIEADLGLPAERIKELIRQIQVNDKKLGKLENDFLNTIEEILEMARDIERGRIMMTVSYTHLTLPTN